MESTFKTAGRAKDDPTKAKIGTMFIIGRPKKLQSGEGYYVMTTAAHILEEILGDAAVIFLRRKESDGSYKKVPYPIKTRDKNSPLYPNRPIASLSCSFAAIEVQCFMPAAGQFQR